MYEKITDSVIVTVRPTYLEEQSSPENNHYVWAYHVTIENQRQETIRLRARYWRITDARGSTQEVAGEGVVGEQPFLDPGGTYEYTSGAPLTTPTGFMSGAYTMEDAAGKRFRVDIPAFSLDSPHQPRAVH